MQANYASNYRLFQTFSFVWNWRVDVLRSYRLLQNVHRITDGHWCSWISLDNACILLTSLKSPLTYHQLFPCFHYNTSFGNSALKFEVAPLPTSSWLFLKLHFSWYLLRSDYVIRYFSLSLSTCSLGIVSRWAYPRGQDHTGPCLLQQRAVEYRWQHQSRWLKA